MLTYLNANGPGDYEIQHTVGTNIVNSTKQTGPKYSMGKPNKLPAHAEYAKDFLMKDSPAIKYNPKIEQVKQ